MAEITWQNSKNIYYIFYDKEIIKELNKPNLSETTIKIMHIILASKKILFPFLYQTMEQLNIFHPVSQKVTEIYLEGDCKD